MEPPPIQYVRTPDGFDIAYTVCGEGVPFVFMPWPWSHRGLMWQTEFGGSLLETLASRFRLICYDSRGQGMSTRGLPEDHCIDDYLTDLVSVVDRLGLDRFVLMGCPLFGHVAVKYAVQHPERVLALFIANTLIDTAWGHPTRPVRPIEPQDWDSFTYMMAAGGSVADAPIETPYWREALTREDYLVMARAARESSIADLLPKIEIPTLVGTNRFLRDRVTPNPLARDARAMAALIPNARLDIADTDGDILLPRGSEPPRLVQMVEDLLKDAGLTAKAAPAPVPPSHLSAREIEVLRLIVQGRSNQEIASELVLSVRTVERHVSNIYAKIGVRGKGAAIAYALRSGLA
jgi:pimeloyl-ACP methyl ester carboxylesterase/DNA-binding CsgD family transcriptional regulator